MLCPCYSLWIDKSLIKFSNWPHSGFIVILRFPLSSINTQILLEKWWTNPDKIRPSSEESEWLRDTLRRSGNNTGWQPLKWNPQGKRKRDRPTIHGGEEENSSRVWREEAKTWEELKSIGLNRMSWKPFVAPPPCNSKRLKNKSSLTPVVPFLPCKEPWGFLSIVLLG